MGQQKITEIIETMKIFSLVSMVTVKESGISVCICVTL